MFRANVLKVMIASPGDVFEERRVVTEQIHRWNDANASVRQLVLLPIKWETHSTPQMGAHPQSIINRQLLDDADIVIGIFGTRIGTPTHEYVSGTVEEIKRHVADGKTAKVYFSDVPIAPSELNAPQYALVQEFQEECRSTGLYATFASIQDFSRDFRQHLDIELNEPRYRWLAAPGPPNDGETPLGQDALRLLMAAAATDDGMIIIQATTNGYGLGVGEEEFMDGTPRSTARWKSALAELERAGALETISENIYRVTDAGYATADSNDEPPDETASPFDDFQRNGTRQLLDSFSPTHRDLLRFLLLRGGSTRSNVIHVAWNNQSIPFDWNGLTSALATKGLVEVTQNLMEGHSTVTVNAGMSLVIKELLFPRQEGNTKPFFTGM